MLLMLIADKQTSENLMKFVIDCRNISVVIKAGISHKKLFIKNSLTISLFPISFFMVPV